MSTRQAKGIAVPTFNQRVYALVREVPSGRVVTYGLIALLLGDPRKAREVGWALHRCPPDVPAHRVVNHRGELSGRRAFGDAQRQQRLLEEEGIEFGADGACDLDRHLWREAVAPVATV